MVRFPVMFGILQILLSRLECTLECLFDFDGICSHFFFTWKAFIEMMFFCLFALKLTCIICRAGFRPKGGISSEQEEEHLPEVASEKKGSMECREGGS